eukprot:7458252-Ditylum_brightwellii.AAC.1
MTRTTVPVKSERERMLALCATIDVHEHTFAVPAGGAKQSKAKSSASISTKNKAGYYKNWRNPKNWLILEESLRMARLIGPANVITEIP